MSDNPFERVCWSGPCTPKGRMIDGFCKCQQDAAEIVRLSTIAVSLAEALEKLIRHAMAKGGRLASDHPDIIAARAALAKAKGET